MFALPGLWAIFTVVAAAAQTARNAMQRNLIATLGTIGATHVRFLYGFPFALIFLGIVNAAVPGAAPKIHGSFLLWTTFGAIAQIGATALMLAAMKERSFVVTTAYMKTEPVLVALVGVFVLGDHLAATAWVAIIIATAGIVLMSWKPGAEMAVRPAILGIASAALFGLAAVGFRGAIRSLEAESFITAATTTLAWGLGIQTLILTTYLLVTDRAGLMAIFRAWRPSIGAGFLGAFASQFWFLAFALETVAKVRTLALIEVLFAGLVSGAIIKQATSPRDAAGIVLIVIGVGVLVSLG
ncbi:EamA/RhaT family transporter [Phreatobacter aquaticus]|uniref:EamA/RhaT family transporter n=1 Tax=Phreatobacter aquaticus TaxID=2570229 RepID=A0A4D7QST1_9HYPH|nr:DMT family transporter [Phreatobacter aquaticus]QCK88469.1 EamA/RhaT family transporter [Phreatobacter aquaticus]